MKTFSRVTSKGPLSILCLAAVISLGAFEAIDAQSIKNSDHLIVPGKRIGSVTLGMSDQALFKLGVPDATGVVEVVKKTLIYRYGDFLVVDVDQGTHKVVSIVLYRDRSYHTAEGVRIGSSVVDIEKAMGPPEQVMANPFRGNETVGLIYDSGNLKFSFLPAHGRYSDPAQDTVQSIEMKVPSKEIF